MNDECLSKLNVIYEFYKAAMNGEITKSEFFKAKEIISRARPLNQEGDAK